MAIKVFTLEIATSEKAKAHKAALAAKGIKVNLKKGTGSMKCYYGIYVKRVNGTFGNFTPEERAGILAYVEALGGLDVFCEPITTSYPEYKAVYDLWFQLEVKK